MRKLFPALAALLLFCSAAMGQIKIRELTTDGAPADTDMIPVAKTGGTTVKTTRGSVRADIPQYTWAAGHSAGQQICGGTSPSETLTLKSTCDATKGKILFGSSAYDEVNNRLGLGTQSPGALLDVQGAAIFNETGTAVDFRVESDTNANMLFVQGSTDRVGIGTASPAKALDVNGDTQLRSDLTFLKGGSPFLGPSDAFDLRLGVSGTESVRVMVGNNFGIGATSVGTSGTRVLALLSGVAPTTSPTDTVQIYGQDSAAGNAQVFARNEAGNAVQLTGLRSFVASNFSAASNTTLANITGLTFPVLGAKTYGFRGVLFVDSSAAGGHKFAVAGTATATTLIWHVRVVCDATKLFILTARTQSMGTGVGESSSSCTSSIAEIDGAITVNAAGTLTLQFAQNNASGTSSVLALSHFVLMPM